jgi:hypothetical protein
VVGALGRFPAIEGILHGVAEGRFAGQAEPLLQHPVVQVAEQWLASGLTDRNALFLRPTCC